MRWLQLLKHVHSYNKQTLGTCSVPGSRHTGKQKQAHALSFLSRYSNEENQEKTARQEMESEMSHEERHRDQGPGNRDSGRASEGATMGQRYMAQARAGSSTALEMVI